MTAVRRVAGKLGGLLLTLFLASLLVFFSRFLVPGDPVDFLLRGRKPSAEAVAQVTAQYGLDLPPWQQYLNWLGGVLHGDFGRSLQYRQDVTVVLGERLPVTLGLVVMAGADDRRRRAHRRHGRRAEPWPRRRPSRARRPSPSSARFPSFVGSIVLIAVFAVQLGWFPSFGSGEGFFDTVYHLVLPSDRAGDRVHGARGEGDAFGDGRAARPRARRGRDQPRAVAGGRRPAPRLPQRAVADPHGERHAGRRASRGELDRRVGIRPRGHRIAPRAVGRPPRLPRGAGDRPASSWPPSSSSTP